jgi:hypothetical protein
MSSEFAASALEQPRSESITRQLPPHAARRYHGLVRRSLQTSPALRQERLSGDLEG